jgi:hypothetical protein
MTGSRENTASSLHKRPCACEWDDSIYNTEAPVVNCRRTFHLISLSPYSCVCMNAARGLHDLPISQRPSSSWHRKLNALLWCIAFNLGCLMVHGFQVVFLLPLRALPFRWSRKLYDQGICYTKGAFGCLLSPSSLASLLNSLT